MVPSPCDRPGAHFVSALELAECPGVWKPQLMTGCIQTNFRLIPDITVILYEL